MKAFIAIIFILLSINCYAQVNNVVQLQSGIDKQLFLDPNKFDGLASISSQLPLEMREFAYNNGQKSDAVGGLLLNIFLPGFGIGNYVIGDTSGGTLNLLGFLASAITLALGSSLTEPGIPPIIRQISTLGMVVSGIGGAGAAFFVIRGWISPFIYQNMYNENLKKLLLPEQQKLTHSANEFELPVLSISF
jgi:hypothetical protein